MDTSNLFMVHRTRDKISVSRAKSPMTREEALNLAAWLVEVAEGGSDFQILLEMVNQKPASKPRVCPDCHGSGQYDDGVTSTWCPCPIGRGMAQRSG